MRVYDFDVKCIAIFKAETHAPLVVDTNTLLSGAITLSALDYLSRLFSSQFQSFLFDRDLIHSIQKISSNQTEVYKTDQSRCLHLLA